MAGRFQFRWAPGKTVQNLLCSWIICWGLQGHLPALLWQMMFRLSVPGGRCIISYTSTTLLLEFPCSSKSTIVMEDACWGPTRVPTTVNSWPNMVVWSGRVEASRCVIANLQSTVWMCEKRRCLAARKLGDNEQLHFLVDMSSGLAPVRSPFPFEFLPCDTPYPEEWVQLLLNVIKM